MESVAADASMIRQVAARMLVRVCMCRLLGDGVIE
jgi:hypothetical protein